MKKSNPKQPGKDGGIKGKTGLPSFMVDGKGKKRSVKTPKLK